MIPFILNSGTLKTLIYMTEEISACLEWGSEQTDFIVMGGNSLR